MLLTTDPGPNTRPSLHPRLTVARGRVRELAEALDGPVVNADDLACAAEELAAERSPYRTAARARLDAAAARVVHDLETATSQLEHLDASRQTLLDGAQWASDIEGELPAYVEAVDVARATLEARQADQRAARARLDRVLEQRTAASAAIGDADCQLDELVGVGMDESGLRRELEASGQAVRAAHDAHAAAVARVQDLMGERDAVEQQCAQLREGLAGHHPLDLHADEDFDRVLARLDDWTRAAQGADLDPYAQALADAFTDLLADLAELEQQSGPRPDEQALQHAQEQVERAARELHRLDGDAAAPVLTAVDRAELDAAHQAADAAVDRSERHFGKAAALKKLDQARAAERLLLDRFGFGSYLDVVLTGGRTTTSTPARLAAERAYLAAKATRDGLQRARRGSPELEHLHSERARLLAHVVDRLGVDPGAEIIALLRVHPLLPGSVVEGLREALASVGVFPVGVSLAQAAGEWLRHQAAAAEEHRSERAAARETEAELEALVLRCTRLAEDLAAARQVEARAAEQLELASRSVGAVEAELSVRAGEDTTRLKRFVAAEQLRIQVEALAATLSRAEHDARASFDRATEAATAAEVAFDRAQGALGDLARRARTLAEELPIDQRPTGDRLATLGTLAGLLRDHAEVLQPAIDGAGAAVAVAMTRVDEAVATAEAAGTGADGPRIEDVEDGLGRLLSAQGEDLIVLDDPFRQIDVALRPRLLELVVGHDGPGSLVLLTEDADILGWAIGLPADQAAVAAAGSLLNLSPRKADTKTTSGPAVELCSAGSSPANVPSDSDPAPKAPARLSAGQR